MPFKLRIKHFKSIQNISFEPGKINVLIGANGSGKSSILEAIGVLSAAIGERVDDGSLSYRGVRLGTPALYKASFKNQDRIPLTIELGFDWENESGKWQYNVNLNNKIDKPEPSWEYHSERLNLKGKRVFGRSRATSYRLDNFPEIEIDKFKSLFAFLRGIRVIQKAEDIYKTFNEYAIYTPNTSTLRGIQPDVSQREPLGLYGGRLSEAVEELLNTPNDLFGTLDLEELLDLLDWVHKITIGKPTKDMLSPSVPSTQKVIRFTDRYMRKGRNELTSYDASEGSLFVLFVLILAIHKATPRMFAIDNFDSAMNPRLARKTTELFCQEVLRNDKIAFMTTHNPLVLDGLNLNDERIRLFSVERNSRGHTQINRITVTEEFMENNKEGYTLSRLWVMGRLGGVPNL